MASETEKPTLDRASSPTTATPGATLNEVFGDIQFNSEVISPKTVKLIKMKGPTEIKMPSRLCDANFDFLNSMNDFNIDGNIRSLSLDPVIKRLIQEKTNILRSIEGWVASQSSDGARQVALAKVIAEWSQKAIAFMRCGRKIVKQADRLISGMMDNILTVIGTIEDSIMYDINSANRFLDFIEKQKIILRKNGIIVSSFEFLATTDIFALFAEMEKAYAELEILKQKYSRDHFNVMKESLIDTSMALIESLNLLILRIRRNRTVKESLTASLGSLQAAVNSIKSLDLDIPINPGGLNQGGLINYSITNDGALFSEFDALTKVDTLVEWDRSPISIFNKGAVSDWTDIFTSNEVGTFIVPNNDYGVFQICSEFGMQKKCLGSLITVRLVLNGGDWVIEAKLMGDRKGDRDDPSVFKYATKNGTFMIVPSAPNPSTRMKVTFSEFIQSFNRPSNLVTGTIVTDPTNPDPATNKIAIPEKNKDYVLDYSLYIDTPNWNTIDENTWPILNQRLRRFPLQSEIDYYENEYCRIMQTLGISPTYYHNRYADKEDPLYNPNDPRALDQFLRVELIPTIDPKITRMFRIPNDTQLKEKLLGKKPFSGIQIFVKSISFQIKRQAPFVNRVPYFLARASSSGIKANVVKFGMKANWGFSPVTLF